MNILIGFGIVVIWLWYRFSRPYQFRIVELDGVYTLERKGDITGIWYDELWQSNSGNIEYSEDHTISSRHDIYHIKRALEKYNKYKARNDRKKIIRVELVQEDVIPEPKKKEEYKIEEMSYLEKMAALKN